MPDVPLLVFNDHGIYCTRADVYIDPWKPVQKAIITHGHSDHARWGHRHYLTHHDNVPILHHRLGTINIESKNWNESFTIRGVRFTLFPAGHIPGSSQVLVEYKGERWVFTGDFKTENDGLSHPFEAIPCHTFITECTFGLPIFQWRPQEDTFRDIARWHAKNQKEGYASVIFAYALGKAQRLIHGLYGQVGAIYTHGAVENLNEVIREMMPLPETRRITRETSREELRGQLIIAPPSAHGTPWIRKMSPFATASVSGWMSIRGTRRRRAIDKGFVLSDHADWAGLQDAISATGARRIICTHGYTDLFARYLRDQGYEAYSETTDYLGEQVDESDAAA
jgi:putative mRNA 3-end processing factor